MRFVLSALLLVSAAPALRAQATFLQPVRSPAGGWARAPGFVPPPAPATTTQTFQVVDDLPHHDDFWANMLTGDADHDGRQEIVIRYVPVSGSGARQIQFWEDDGTGNFDRVFAFPLFDGGLLSIGDVDDDGLTDLFFERANGFCNHEFVRYEASSAAGFPDHEVWSAQKEGNVVDFWGFIADSDGDGAKEFVTGDSDFGCTPTSLKVFESLPGNQMGLVFDMTLGGNIGNPVVADFDLDGRREIAVADGIAGAVYLFESTGDNTWVPTLQKSNAMFNSYQLALIDRNSPDLRPMLFLVGQMNSQDYRVQVFEAAANDDLTQINETLLPALCGASIPQIWATDVLGNRVPEIIVDRLCDPVPVYTVGAGGALTLFDTPFVTESLEVAATKKTAAHSGALAIGTYPTGVNPQGKTKVLILQ